MQLPIQYRHESKTYLDLAIQTESKFLTDFMIFKAKKIFQATVIERIFGCQDCKFADKHQLSVCIFRTSVKSYGNVLWMEFDHQASTAVMQESQNSQGEKKNSKTKIIFK